ncbi:MAG: hypothetical protein M1826_003157 [Phylliscum demangeonii]|nr:MAG: hypothetical protein M1826_003157 [Phylliscum demangeonii]
MSEPIPESITTYSDHKSRRAVKKRALTPVSAQASQLDALFAQPDKEVTIPLSATKDGGGPRRRPGPPPEIVANVQGSSAGAGSGEFHVYKASRRREYERLRLMDEDMKRETEQTAFEVKQTLLKRSDDAKTSRNKNRREKAKARRLKGRGEGEGEGGGVEGGAEMQGVVGAGGGTAKTSTTLEKGLGRAADPGDRNGHAAVVEEAGVVIHDDDD